jgi:hypothetical protein
MEGLLESDKALLSSPETVYRQRPGKEIRSFFRLAKSQRDLALPAESVQRGSEKSHKHEPLPTPRSIRLIRFEPFQPGSKIRAALRVVDLDSQPTYIALSYTWGSPLPLTNSSQSHRHQHDILIDGATIKIEQNLYDFFTTVQGTIMNEEEFWIDALCIDQSSVEEKNVQVPMMADIYYHAEHVAIWLGKGDESTCNGITVMQLFNDSFAIYIQDMSKLARTKFGQEMDWKPDDIELYRLLNMEPPNQEEWESMRHLFRRSWFSRLWVVQELMMAQSYTFLCGDMAIPAWTFETFCKFMFYNRHFGDLLVRENAASIIHSYQQQRDSYFGLTDLFFRASSWRNNGPMDPFEMRILFNITGCQSWSVNLNKMTNAYLVWVVHNLRERTATDPRDHIYAAISMVSRFALKGHSSLPTVDYTRAVADIYVDFCRHILENIRRPVFLTMRGLEKEDSIRNGDLPSWVPDFSQASGSAPNSWIKKFNSSGISAHVGYRSGGQIKDNRLYITGAFVDTVEEVSDTIDNVMPASSLMKLLFLAYRAKASSVKSPLEALMKTLTCDWTMTSSTVGKPEAYTRDRYIQDLFDFLLPFLRSADLVKEFEECVSATSSPDEYQQFWTLNQRNLIADAINLGRDDSTRTRGNGGLPWSILAGAHATRHRVALGRARKYLALVPKNTKPGDELWVLSNGALPFVLCREKDQTDSIVCFELVGEAYVDGFSNGELIEQSTKEVPTVSIALV